MYVLPIETYRPSILVIDDNAAVRSGIENALSFHGLNIFHASSPQEIRATLQVKQIDLVLADLVMSPRRRAALVAAIRGAARRNPREVPVVAMSEREMWEDLKMFSAADAIGATAVLRKPLSAGTLIQLLDNLLQSTADHADTHPLQRRYIEDNFQDNSGDHPARARNRLH